MSRRINPISINLNNNNIERENKPASVIKVHDNDVLSGRGVNIAHHPGNKRFRTLITSRQDDAYCTTYSASEKRAVAMEIIKHIHSLDPPGRFLRREGRGQVSRGLNGPWDVLTERECVKKTCQALRDCNRTDRTGYAAGVDMPEDVARNKAELDASGLTKKQQATAAAAASVVASAVEAASNLKRSRANSALTLPKGNGHYIPAIPFQATDFDSSLFPGKMAMDANKNMTHNHEQNGETINKNISVNNTNQSLIFPNVSNSTGINNPVEFKRFSPSVEHATEWLKKQRGLVNIIPRTFTGTTNQNNSIIQPDPINMSTNGIASNYPANNVQRNQNTSTSNTSSILERNTLNINTTSQLNISNTNTNKTMNGTDISYHTTEKAPMNVLFSQPLISNANIGSMNMGIPNDGFFNSNTSLANPANPSANNLPMNNMQSLELAHALNIFGSSQPYLNQPVSTSTPNNMPSLSGPTPLSTSGASTGIMPLTVNAQPPGSISVPGFIPTNMTLPMASQFAGNISTPDANANLMDEGANKNHSGLQTVSMNMTSSNHNEDLRQQNSKNMEQSQLAMNNYNHELHNVMGGDYDLGVSSVDENIVVSENLLNEPNQNGNSISATNINLGMNTKGTLNPTSHVGLNMNLSMGANMGMSIGTSSMVNGSDNISGAVAIEPYSQGMNSEN